MWSWALIAPRLLYPPSLSLVQLRAVCDWGGRATDFRLIPSFSIYPRVLGTTTASQQESAVHSMLYDALVSTQLQVAEPALFWQSYSRECLGFNCGSLIGLGYKILDQTYSTALENLRVECFLLSLNAMPPVHRSEPQVKSCGRSTRSMRKVVGVRDADR